MAPRNLLSGVMVAAVQGADLIAVALIAGLVLWLLVALGGVTFVTSGKGRMLCPLCGKGLKGTRMVTVNGTVYHQKCYQRRGRRA